MTTTLEYFDLWAKYRDKYNNNESYNEKIILLMQIGSFYEIYEYDPEQCPDDQHRCSTHRPGVVYRQRMGSALAVSNIIDLVVKQWHKNKPHSIHNPYKGGFPCVAYERKLPYLSREGFIVIRADQYKENGVIKRKVVEEETPGTSMNEGDIGLASNTNNVLSIYIMHQKGVSSRNMVITCGVSSVDVITGMGMVSEMYSQNDDTLYAMREINRVILSLRPKEIIINLVHVPPARQKTYGEFLTEQLCLDQISNIIWHWDEIDPEIQKINYQQSFLSKIFGSRLQQENKLIPSTNDVDNIMGNLGNSNSSSSSSSSVYVAPINGEEYNNHILEFLKLDQLEFARMSYILLLQYCYAINERIVDKLQVPNVNWLDQDKHLILTNNALQQIDIVAGEYRYSRGNKVGPLFDVVNFTSTRLGHRMLYQRLVNPITDVNLLNESYSQIQELMAPPSYFIDGSLVGSPGGKPLVDELERHLRGMPDISRFQRLLDLQIIKPPEFARLYQGYLQVIDIYMFILNCPAQYLKKLLIEGSQIANFNSFFQYIHSVFIMEYEPDENGDRPTPLNLLESATMGTDVISSRVWMTCSRNPFRLGVNHTLDSIQSTIEGSRQHLLKICQHLNSFLTRSRGKLLSIDDNTCYNENGLITTAAKANTISKSQIDTQLCGVIQIIPANKNGKAITSSIIEQLCNNLSQLQTQYETQLYLTYSHIITHLSSTFNFGLSVARMVASVDFVKSGARLALKYKYHVPVIEGDGSKSFIHIKHLRHPIVEQNIPTPYVPNDISLCDTQLGYLLYGANSTGKSTLTKSVGLALILAQAGYYVPGHMSYYPFSRIITRLSGNDDLLHNKSSFVIEMDELSIILQYADSRTLVLGDELCRGTETTSGTAITVATLEELVRRQSRFIFSTHMHSLVHIPEIKSIGSLLCVCHLDINYDNDRGELIITRHLQSGPGNGAYGIEIAKGLGINRTIIDRSIELRHRLFDQGGLLSTQTSKYNSKLYVNSCAMCDSRKNLHSHHIQPQKIADAQGFIQHMHKNNQSNLLVLCAACHQRVHQEGITFRIEQTVSGYRVQQNTDNNSNSNSNSGNSNSGNSNSNSNSNSGNSNSNSNSNSGNSSNVQ